MFVHLSSNQSSKSILEIIPVSFFAFFSTYKDSREFTEPYIKNFVSAELQTFCVCCSSASGCIRLCFSVPYVLYHLHFAFLLQKIYLNLAALHLARKEKRLADLDCPPIHKNP